MISYNTISNQSSKKIIERRSKFIGYAKPIEKEEDAVLFINEIKSKHWDARHNVYAYSINNPLVSRYSDDGEPQGTAGLPIMEVINKLQVTNIVIVVTRYFGGILLGTGGLVRAYSQTAKLAIESAGVIKMCMCKNLGVTCEYHAYGKISSCILSLGGIINDTVYSNIVKINCYIENVKYDLLKRTIYDITSARATINVMGESFQQLDI